MKRYGLHFKNIAALLMLCALLSLLLPFCKITTGGTTNSVSGIGIMKMGGKLGAEYVKNGTIENSYKITNGLTWGDVKSSADYASKHEEVKQIALGGAVVLLPVAMIFLAMVLTIFATGKISMILPTILTLLTVLENVLMIVAFPSLQKALLGQAGGATVTLLIGIYAFTILCIIALFIILMLWLTGGFNQPEGRERDYSDGREKKKKSRFSRDGKRRKKRRRRKGRRKGKKKSGKDTAQPENRTQPQKTEEATSPVTGATGQVSGLAGMYQGTNLDLATDANGAFIIGTTPEAREVIINGSAVDAHKLEGHNCLIQYDRMNRQYKVVSHSVTDIILQEGNSQKQVHLRKEESTTVGANTLLFIGDLSNIIKLD